MATELNGPDVTVIEEIEEVIIVENESGDVKEVIIIDEVIVEQPENHHHHHDELHIFVNRIRKTETDGVKHEMNGCEIAGLVPVPCDKAIVKRGRGADAHIINLTEKITICNGEHFLVTRNGVEGGHG